MQKLTFASLIVIFFVSTGYAGQVAPLTQMVSGQTASAADVNDNFNNIATEVDDNDTRIGANETAVTDNASAISDHEAGTALHSDTLNELNCATDQLAKFDGNAWICSGYDIVIGTKYYSVPAASFSPTDSIAEVYHFESGMYLQNSFAQVQLLAPVHLPHGATITKVTAYVVDPDPDKNALVELREVAFGADPDTPEASNLVAGVTSSSSGGGYVAIGYSSGVLSHTVDNQNNCYVVKVSGSEDDLGQNLGIEGVVIEYTL